jgi:hypothetical protein
LNALNCRVRLRRVQNLKDVAQSEMLPDRLSHLFEQIFVGPRGGHGAALLR